MLMPRNSVRTALFLFLTTLLLSPFLEPWSGHFATQEYHVSDEGIVLYAAQRASMGQLPHISFPYYYMGGLEIAVGVIFRWFGSTFEVARWFLAVNMAGMVSIFFLLLVQFSVSIPVAATSAFLSVVIGYVLNYHVHPAWFAMTLVACGMLFLQRGLNGKKLILLIVAGIFLGIATTLKQSTGVFALIAFMYFVFWYHSTHQLTFEHARTSDAFAGLRVFIALLIPVGLFLMLLYVIRLSITLLNFSMFMAMPLLITTVSVWLLSRRALRSPTTIHLVLRSLLFTIVSLAAGFVLGLVPILLCYATQDGLDPLIRESLTKVQTVFSRTEVAWAFSYGGEVNNPLVMLRRLGIYLIPIASIGIGFMWGTKEVLMQQRISVRAQALALNSITLAALWFTLYPLVGIVYLYFLAPMIMVPFVISVDHLLRRGISRPAKRAALVIATIAMAFLVYLGSRLLAGDWKYQGVYVSDIARLDKESGNVCAPTKTVDGIRPVVEYLRTRPENETFVLLNRFNESVAFLTQRKATVDYSLEYYSHHGYSPHSFEEMKWLIEEHKTSTIIVAKEYLSKSSDGKGDLAGSPEEKEFFAYVFQNYSGVLETNAYLFYQLIRP
jgi:hypothetical protein